MGLLLKNILYTVQHPGLILIQLVTAAGDVLVWAGALELADRCYEAAERWCLQ